VVERRGKGESEGKIGKIQGFNRYSNGGGKRGQQSAV